MLGSAPREARRVGLRQGDELTVSDLTKLLWHGDDIIHGPASSEKRRMAAVAAP